MPAGLMESVSLPRLAAGLKDNATKTTILVLNSANGVSRTTPATGAAPTEEPREAAPRTFPNYMQEGLRTRYPDGRVSVLVRNQPRRTAREVLDALPGILAKDKPALLIWQTGTYDAIRGEDIEAFAQALQEGIRLTQEAGSDIILVSPQYSPRTDFAFDVTPYVTTMRWLTRSNGVGFFDRTALMRYWSEEAVFDFSGGRSGAALFNNVHNCIGHLLIRMINSGVELKTVGSH
nr:SGNH/GDSL hydrolase family protein [Ancylobacter crimeensis]